MKKKDIPDELYHTDRVENIIGIPAIWKDVNWWFFTKSKVEFLKENFGKAFYTNKQDEYKTKTYKVILNGFCCYVRTAKGYGTSYEVPKGSTSEHCLKFLEDFEKLYREKEQKNC